MKSCLTLLCLTFSVLLSAQQDIVFEENQPGALHYNYNNLQGPSVATVRDLMREINPQDPRNVEYDLRYNRRTRIYLNANRKVEALLEFQQIVTANIPRYRGFDCSDALRPEGVTVALELTRNGQVISTRTFTNQTIGQDGNAQAIRLEYNDTVSTRNYTLRIVGVDFLYGNNSLTKLRRRTESIRLYETAHMDLQRMGTALMAINLTNPHPDQLQPIANQLAELERNFSGMGNAPFWNELNLRQNAANDPLGLVPSGARFADELLARQTRVTALLSTVHELYYAEALQLYERKDYSGSRRALDKAFAANNRYGPAYYLAATLDFEEKQYARAEDRLQRLVSETSPTPELRRQAFSLADALVRVRLDEAGRLAGERRYKEAEEACAGARTFGQRLQGYALDNLSIDRTLTNIREANFGERLTAAQQLFRDKKFDQAISDIQALKAMQSEFRLRPDVDLDVFRRNVLQEKLRFMLVQTESELQGGRLPNARRGLAEIEAFVNANRADLSGEESLGALRQAVNKAQARQYANELNEKSGAAQQAFAAKRFDQALQYANEGFSRLELIQADFVDMWRTVPELAETPENVRIQLNNLKYKSLYAIGDRELKAKNLPAALQNALEALAFARAARLASDITYAIQLVEDVQLENFQRLVAEGEAAETQGRLQDALERFRQADALDREFSFSQKGRAQGIGGKIYSAASNKMIEKVDKLLSESPDNVRLRREMPLLQDEANREGVGQDAGVVTAFRRLGERLCQNAQRLFSDAMDRCDRQIALSDYQKAQAEMLSAEALLREYSSCSIAPERMNAVREKVNVCAQYQQTLSDAEAKIKVFDHTRAIALFEEAAQQYKNPLVGANLKQHPSGNLYAYLMNEKIGALQLAGANRFSDKNNVDEAYSLLKQAITNRADVRQTMLLQTRLGRAYAEKLFDRNVKSKDALASVCPPEYKKTLKGFQKAFGARWKEKLKQP